MFRTLTSISMVWVALVSASAAMDVPVDEVRAFRAACKQGGTDPAHPKMTFRAEELDGKRTLWFCLHDGFETTRSPEGLPPITKGDLVYVAVNSGGGNAKNFIPYAEYFSQGAWTLVLIDYCVSSCANYLVGAADRIVVKNRPLIGWHGGPENLYEARLSDEQRVWRDEVRAAELALFKNRPNALQLIAASGRFLSCARLHHDLPEDGSVFWAPSLRDLQVQLGVEVVRLDGPFADAPGKTSIAVVDQESGAVDYLAVPKKCAFIMDIQQG